MGAAMTHCVCHVSDVTVHGLEAVDEGGAGGHRGYVPRPHRHKGVVARVRRRGCTTWQVNNEGITALTVVVSVKWGGVVSRTHLRLAPGSCLSISSCPPTSSFRGLSTW